MQRAGGGGVPVMEGESVHYYFRLMTLDKLFIQEIAYCGLLSSLSCTQRWALNERILQAGSQEAAPAESRLRIIMEY